MQFNIKEPIGKNICVPKPLTQIKNYLGICLDSEFKYLNVHIREDVCFLTAEAKSELTGKNEKLNDVFKNVIEILKQDAPITTLKKIGFHFSEGSFENSEDIDFGKKDVFFNYVNNNSSLVKSKVIAGIFYDRIKSSDKDIKPLCSDKDDERYHRNTLANAMEWHFDKNLKNDFKGNIFLNEKRLVHEIYDSSYSSDLKKPNTSTSQEINTKSISSSTGSDRSEKSFYKSGNSPECSDTKRKNAINNSFHISLHDITITNGAFSPRISEVNGTPRKSSKNAQEKEALLNLISKESLYNCRRHWIKAHKKTPEIELEWDKGEYSLLEKVDLLKTPMMQKLLQEELGRDITHDYNPHALMQDIYRSLIYISNSNRTSVSLSVTNDLKESFENNANYFYQFLKKLLLGMGMTSNAAIDNIIDKWKFWVNKEKGEGLSEESFIFSGIKFINDLKNSDFYGTKLLNLLTLLRQKLYTHPMTTIREILSDVPLDYKFDDSNRLMKYNFSNNGVEFQTSLKAIPSKNSDKWQQKEKKCFDCEIDLLNTMRPIDKNLTYWNSELEIKVIIFKSLKDKKLETPPSVQRMIIDPLIKLGFQPNVSYVRS